MYGAGGANAGQDLYAVRDQHFATAPLPPVPPYALRANDAGYRDVYERHTVHDEYFDDARPYATAGAGAAALVEEGRALDAGSDSYSEEEISSGGGLQRGTNEVRSVTVIADQGAGGIKENIETNIERNITKNYIINEERNYFIQKEPVAESAVRLHDQEIQHLPAPTVTTINMAAERITDDPSSCAAAAAAFASPRFVYPRLGECQCQWKFERSERRKKTSVVGSGGSGPVAIPAECSIRTAAEHLHAPTTHTRHST